MLVFSAVPCIIQYSSSEHHIIIPQTHGLIIAGQWALPLSVELLPTATGSYAGVIRSAVGSLNREINVCSTIGPWGLSQTREEPEPCDTRAASLSSCLCSVFSPPDLHLSLFLSSSSSSSAVICFPSLYVPPSLSVLLSFSLAPVCSFSLNLRAGTYKNQKASITNEWLFPKMTGEYSKKEEKSWEEKSIKMEGSEGRAPLFLGLGN